MALTKFIEFALIPCLSNTSFISQRPSQAAKNKGGPRCYMQYFRIDLKQVKNVCGTSKSNVPSAPYRSRISSISLLLASCTAYIGSVLHYSSKCIGNNSLSKNYTAKRIFHNIGVDSYDGHCEPLLDIITPLSLVTSAPHSSSTSTVAR